MEGVYPLGRYTPTLDCRLLICCNSCTITPIPIIVTLISKNPVKGDNLNKSQSQLWWEVIETFPAEQEFLSSDFIEKAKIPDDRKNKQKAYTFLGDLSRRGKLDKRKITRVGKSGSNVSYSRPVHSSKKIRSKQIWQLIKNFPSEHFTVEQIVADAEDEYGRIDSSYIKTNIKRWEETNFIKLSGLPINGEYRYSVIKEPIFHKGVGRVAKKSAKRIGSTLPTLSSSEVGSIIIEKINSLIAQVADLKKQAAEDDRDYQLQTQKYTDRISELTEKLRKQQNEYEAKIEEFKKRLKESYSPATLDLERF